LPLGFFPDDIELPTEDEDEMVRDVSQNDHNIQHSDLLGPELHSRVRYFTLNYTQILIFEENILLLFSQRLKWTLKLKFI